jgi:hypothetical protein
MLVNEPLVRLSIGRSQSFSGPPVRRTAPSIAVAAAVAARGRSRAYPDCRDRAVTCMFTVGRLGLEPRTYGLKVRCSAS